MKDDDNSSTTIVASDGSFTATLHQPAAEPRVSTLTSFLEAVQRAHPSESPSEVLPAELDAIDRLRKIVCETTAPLEFSFSRS